MGVVGFEKRFLGSAQDTLGCFFLVQLWVWALLRRGVSGPVCLCFLVCRFRRVVGRPGFDGRFGRGSSVSGWIWLGCHAAV